MHSLYLSHLAEIANGSRHALAIISRICATFCVLPVYKQLLALMVHEYMYRYIHAPANIATNTIAIPCAIGACVRSACLFWVPFTRSFNWS